MLELPTSFPHRFADPDLLAPILAEDKQRLRELAWLGDKALALALVQMLRADAPQRSLEELSLAVSQLASNRSLAQIARRIDLPAQLSGSFGMRKLATVLEAMIGAVLLDSSIDAVRECVAELYAPLIAQLGEELWQRDATSRLKEFCESGKKGKPRYRLDRSDQQDGYAVICQVEALSSRGHGETLYDAKLAAATAMLQQFDAQPRS